jgi:hypothetical protein
MENTDYIDAGPFWCGLWANCAALALFYKIKNKNLPPLLLF